MISINDSVFLRQLFKDYHIETVKTKYADPLKGGQTKEKNELIITNYDTGKDYDTKHITKEKQEQEDKMKKLIDEHFTHKPPKEDKLMNLIINQLDDDYEAPLTIDDIKMDRLRIDDAPIGTVAKVKGKKRITNNEI
jgi:hypothetical protein